MYEATVLDGVLKDAGERRPDPYVVQRLRTEMREGVKAHSLLDTFESGWVPALRRPPVAADVILKGNGAVSRVNKLATPGVRL
ncbi:hypothetical protein [Streptomyces sp. NRRL F-5755]|uniref:hypothetical protein n=1 Tax=Streptomyces sp. NRRL F-5755 TaxID=1519475 RepID=UPI001F1EDAFD|nr:hypothetical protein [Streptomyces sp. NRRL F-5755]